jgi:hypothetical protein
MATVAQYEVLGTEKETPSVPLGKIDKVALVSHAVSREKTKIESKPHARREMFDRPCRDGAFIHQFIPSTSYWATFIASLAGRIARKKP